MVIGMVIGAGVFFQTKGTLEIVQSPIISILVWVVAGVITIAAGMTVSELAAAIPKTGGIIEYLRVTYNDHVASVCGWMLTTIYFPSLVGVFAIFFAEIFVSFFGLPEVIFGFSSTLVVAFAVITLLVIVNSMNVRLGGKLQNWTTIGKIVPLVLIIVMGLLFGGSNPQAVGFENLAFSLPKEMGTFFVVVFLKKLGILLVICYNRKKSRR